MKVIIIEDEFPVRSALKKMLKIISPELEVIDEADTIKASIDILKTKQPDIVFLDIELKDGVSFEIFKYISNVNFQIVFLTAFNQYALKAFKYSAIDYLLKPIDPEELKQAIKKAKTQIKKESAYQNSLDVLKKNFKKPEQLVIKTSDNSYIIPLSDIIRFEANGAYTQVIYEEGKILCSKNIKHYENLLPNDTFYRCHQSHLVNLKKVIKFTKNTISLTNKESVPISHRKKTELKKLLNKFIT